MIGAGAAALAVAEGLRRGGHGDGIVLVGAEAHLPYDRPPLSKHVLRGDWPAERAALRPADTYERLGVEVRTGVRAVSLDTGRRLLALDDGSRLPYGALVVATGVRPRSLPGGEGIDGVHGLRTLDDALALRRRLAGRPRLVVVGGGFIGAEAAAVARELNCDVTLVTNRAVLLADALGVRIGGLLARLHQERGVRIEAGVPVAAVVHDGHRATGVRLADGRLVAADAVLVGIGSLPNTDWLAGSGVPVGDGVLCDATLRAADGVWAAGDVASWPDPAAGGRLRIEHRTNAAEQGLTVAHNLLAAPGEAAAFTTVPYVWTDQYHLKLQIYGRTRGADRLRIVEGSPDEGKFTALYGRDGRVVAALGVDMPRALRTLRPLVATPTPWPTPWPDAVPVPGGG
ncbi:NAD(P)/FAD-dependent oxidoreductase [Streptomyces sp. NBC_01190]|uniref:NAD(P)/FAD-dependent oxidoreductase n=1 Tax=Streptomyces sp. NBC_01190 TaxID=2903767 RepID=UPI00386F08A4|nr:FAD-dependent oxidoreductase [Streptomyces sp. NBC_01190]